MRTPVPSSSVISGISGGLHFLIARRGHLERRRKIRPQLEPVHAPALIALGHFLMDDPAPRRHPLNVAGRDAALVPHAIGVIHGSGQHVGDGLDAAMRMPRKARQIIVGNIVAKIIEKQKRIEVGCIAETERAPQMHPRALKRRLGLDEPLHWSNGQFGLPYPRVPCSCPLWRTQWVVAHALLRAAFTLV